MKVLKFKTNINCGGCIANVKPVLDKLAGETAWQVDISDRDKTLTIHSDTLAAEDVVAALKAIDYNATPKP